MSSLFRESVSDWVKWYRSFDKNVYPLCCTLLNLSVVLKLYTDVIEPQGPIGRPGDINRRYNPDVDRRITVHFFSYPSLGSEEGPDSPTSEIGLLREPTLGNQTPDWVV